MGHNVNSRIGVGAARLGFGVWVGTFSHAVRDVVVHFVSCKYLLAWELFIIIVCFLSSSVVTRSTDDDFLTNSLCVVFSCKKYRC